MAQLFTKQQVRTWLRENNLKTAKSIEDAFTAEIKDVLQEALEEEMTNELGYTIHQVRLEEQEHKQFSQRAYQEDSKKQIRGMDIYRDGEI